MARGHSIHVVMYQGRPIAGFTVKHELDTWLERKKGVLDESAIEVVKVLDGLWRNL